MSRHTLPLETRSAMPLETRSDENDPLAAATAAVEELRSAAEQRHTAHAAEVRGLSDRIASLETRLSRPNVQTEQRNEPSAEMRAFGEFLRTGNEVELRAASSDNATSGGYFVLPTVDTAIRDVLADISPMRSLAEVVTITGDTYERFYSMGKRGAQRVAERDDRPQDTARPELIKHSYGVGEYYAAPAGTRQLLDDSPVNIASWLLRNAATDFAISEGEDFLTYDGTGGFPRGLLNYGTTNEKDFTRAWGKHQYIPAGHATAPTDANLATACINIVAALRKPYKANATWLMHSTTAARLMGITDENGRRLWAPTGNLIEGVEHPLLGYRVELDDSMPTIGAGEHPIAYGDFRQGYVIVDRHGIKTEIDRVTQKGRVIFDTYKRVGGGAGDFNAIKFVKVAAS